MYQTINERYLRWEVIVHFVDVGVIVDYHCLNFLFIIRKSPIMYSIIFHIILLFETNSSEK
jgi:hypothetical protein